MPNATIFDPQTIVNIGCTEYECGAVYFMSHKGWYHETSQTLNYLISNPETNGTISSAAGLTFSSSQWLGAVYGAKQMTTTYPVSGLPRCNVRAEGNTVHKAWWGKTLSISASGVTVNSAGIVGFVAASSVATPKSAPACPPMIDNPCDNPYTDEIETECSGAGSGPLVAGGTGNTESPGAEHNGGANSRWVCDVTFWYHSDDNGATWYYTGRYDVIGNCSLEAR